MVVMRNTAVTKHELKHKAWRTLYNALLVQVDRFKDVGRGLE